MTPEFISILRYIRDEVYPDVQTIEINVTNINDQANATKLVIEASALDASNSAAAALISEQNASASEQNANTDAAQVAADLVLATQAKDDAETAANQVTGLSAQANTLIAGSQATASYNPVDGILTLGIPQGPKGDTGDSYNPDATGLFTDRSLYDNTVPPFSFLATDTSTIYFKASATSGDWGAGSPFGKGDKGDQGDIGIGIDNIAFLSTTDGSGLPAQSGATDTYRVTYTNANTFDYEIYNGADSAVTSVNGNTGDVVLDKSDVGLDQVDNTSDANKPVSIATQAAIDANASYEKAASVINQGYDSLVLGATTATLTNGIFHFANGKNDKGFIISDETDTAVIDFSGVAWDGDDYVCKVEASGYIHEQYRPSLSGLYDKDSVEDNKKVYLESDNTWYNTIADASDDRDTFDSTLEGWTAINSNNIVLDIGTLEADRTGGTSAYLAVKTYTTVIGETYKFKFDVTELQNGSNVRIRIGTSQDSLDVLNGEVYTATGSYEIEYVAQSTTTYIHLVEEASSTGISNWDNIQHYKKRATLGSALTSSISPLKYPFDVLSGSPQSINTNVDPLSSNVLDGTTFTGIVEAYDTLKISKTEFLNDGVDYVDPDAVGANPTAKIYPDGTIVGSTDNGNYVKFPDGTLICDVEPTISSNTSLSNAFGTGAGTVYYGAYLWTFPIVNTLVSLVTCSAKDTSNIRSFVAYSHSTNSVQCRPFTGSSQTSKIFKFGMVGRWK